MEGKIVVVAAKHIEPGIKKYNGTLDAHLKALFEREGFQYEPYVFEDGRVLVVIPSSSSALLYPDIETLYKSVDLHD